MSTATILNEIKKTAKAIGRNVNLMEICGTHTQAISRHGIRALMPANVKLTTGPGCPVCVLPQTDIDSIVALALAGVPIASYGDVMRVPGSKGSLEKAKEKGAKVFTVYSVNEALELKNEYPDLVFFGYGFETTAPMTAFAIKNGLAVYSAHKLFLPAMEALLKIKETNIDGFIAPGHVSAIVGIEPYKKIKAPQVITGFEQDDVLVGIYKLLKLILAHKLIVENEYLRAVKQEGNPKALDLIFEIFEREDSLWRGFGNIPASGLKIKNKFKKFDAKIKYKNILAKIDFSKHQKPSNCICEKIVLGIKAPSECPMYKKVCTPDNPRGACMVSVEGACHVMFRYD